MRGWRAVPLGSWSANGRQFELRFLCMRQFVPRVFASSTCSVAGTRYAARDSMETLPCRCSTQERPAKEVSRPRSGKRALRGIELSGAAPVRLLHAARCTLHRSLFPSPVSCPNVIASTHFCCIHLFRRVVPSRLLCSFLCVLRCKTTPPADSFTAVLNRDIPICVQQDVLHHCATDYYRVLWMT